MGSYACEYECLHALLRINQVLSELWIPQVIERLRVEKNIQLYGGEKEKKKGTPTTAGLAKGYNLLFGKESLNKKDHFGRNEDFFYC